MWKDSGGNTTDRILETLKDFGLDNYDLILISIILTALLIKFKKSWDNFLKNNVDYILLFSFFIFSLKLIAKSEIYSFFQSNESSNKFNTEIVSLKTEVKQSCWFKKNSLIEAKAMKTDRYSPTVIKKKDNSFVIYINGTDSKLECDIYFDNNQQPIFLKNCIDDNKSLIKPKTIELKNIGQNIYIGEYKFLETTAQLKILCK